MKLITFLCGYKIKLPCYTRNYGNEERFDFFSENPRINHSIGSRLSVKTVI